MARQAVTASMQIDGIRQTLDALTQLPKDANAEIRSTSLELAERLRARAAAAATAQGRQGPLVARTVKTKSDRIPTVTAGGRSPRLGRGRARPDQLLFGTEFGSDRFKQFGKPHIGRGSYWFFRTLEREQPAIRQAWEEAAAEVVRRFSRGSVA